MARQRVLVCDVETWSCRKRRRVPFCRSDVYVRRAMEQALLEEANEKSVSTTSVSW